MTAPPSSEEPPASGEAALLHGRAVADLVRDHNRALHAFLMTRVRDEHEATEIAQEAYVRMLQLQKPGAVSFLRAYLFKTAANIAIDRAQDRRRYVSTTHEPDNEAEIAEPADELTPERRLLGAEDLDVLQQALQELTPKCRDAFLMCRMQDFSDAQIGAQLGIQPRMVRNYLTRAALYCQLRVKGLSAEAARAISG